MFQNILKLMIFFIISVFLFSCGQNSLKMSSVSMEPTIKEGEIIQVDFSAYETDIPQRWEIVSLKSPKMENTDWCMRIVGLPGETIDFDSLGLTINSQRLSSPNGIAYTYDPESNKGLIDVTYPYRIPQNAYYVLGDNVKEAYDSRYWGAIHKKAITGKVIID